jgi:hypothetical protein
MKRHQQGAFGKVILGPVGPEVEIISSGSLPYHVV